MFTTLANADINWTCSFFRLVSFRGELLNILMPAYYVLFCKRKSLVVGLLRWCLFHVVMLCTNEVLWKFSLLFTAKSIYESMYSRGMSQIRNLFDRLLRGFLRFSPTIILRVFFLRVNIFFNFAASQEIPRIYGTRKSRTVPTSARHPSLSWANSIQSPLTNITTNHA